MVITQPAIICLAASTNRIRRWIMVVCNRSQPAPPPPSITVLPAQPAVDTASIVTDSPPASAAEVPLSPTERRARAAALRGMMLARQRRLDAAEAAFIEAARLDPSLDLTAIPTFWQLERGAHEATIRAYVASGRQRDANELTARMRKVFRPRLVAERAPPPLIAARR